MTDRQVTERYIVSAVGISQERVHSILTEDLEMRKFSALWVARLLTFDQKHTSCTLLCTNLNLFEEDPANFLNPFPNKPWFLRACSTSLLKTLWEKKKLLVTSNFFFSHSVFYPFRELSTIFIKFKIVICKLFAFGRV